MRSYKEYEDLDYAKRLQFLLNHLDLWKHWCKNIMPQDIGYPYWGTGDDIAYKKVFEGICGLFALKLGEFKITNVDGVYYVEEEQADEK